MLLDEANECFGDFSIASHIGRLGEPALALVNKICLLDLAARKAKRVERPPRKVVEDAIGRLVTLFE